MKRDLTSLSISKIYIFLGIVSIAGIFLLFFFPRQSAQVKEGRTNRDLINQVLHAAIPTIKSAWTSPSLYISKKECGIPSHVGEAYLECNSEGWVCLWKNKTHLNVEHAGKVYQLTSSGKITFIQRDVQGIQNRSGYIADFKIDELGVEQKIFLPKTCHEMYLPERIYGYGEVSDPRKQGFLWDNAGRKIFVDKFYVSQKDIYEWKKHLGEEYKTANPWEPAKLKEDEQNSFCRFHGKKRLQAHIFDATQMTPQDFKIPFPDMVVRPDTPWQRDYNRTFLAESTQEGFKLTSQDCSLAQVKGCAENYFMTDSVSWTGVAFGLGFEEEVFNNPIEPELNLKKSSKFEEAQSQWHKLGRRGSSEENKEYAFRCFREIL